MQKRILVLAAIIILGAAGIWVYQIYSARYPSTEDAYISANVVRVAPRVTGRVATLDVANQQRVNKGQVMFTIDPTPYRYALAQATARLALAKREVSQAEASVASAQAEVHNREVLLENARTKLHRAHRLIKKDYISTERVTDAEAAFKSAQANLEVAKAKLEEAKRQLGVSGDKNDRIVEAKAALDQAEWQLQNTTVTAACSGRTSELSLQPGNVVNANQDTFVIVCSHNYWVYANFKETQLERIHPGQSVKIDVDMYPGHTFKGIVEDINPASGSVFSLLPPQNANGNWVKVIQRVPVKIRVENPNPKFPLLVGTSTTVTVNTTSPGKKEKLADNASSNTASPPKPAN